MIAVLFDVALFLAALLGVGLAEVLVLVVTHILFAPARVTVPDFPEYEPNVRPERWSDNTGEQHVTDALAIQRSIERSQAAVKGLLADRDELAKRREARR